MCYKEAGKERAVVVEFKRSRNDMGCVKEKLNIERTYRAKSKNKRIGIDRTRKEREENAKLREELRQKREGGGR